jgi:hypothetical protein
MASRPGQSRSVHRIWSETSITANLRPGSRAGVIPLGSGVNPRPGPCCTEIRSSRSTWIDRRVFAPVLSAFEETSWAVNPGLLALRQEGGSAAIRMSSTEGTIGVSTYADRRTVSAVKQLRGRLAAVCRLATVTVLSRLKREPAYTMQCLIPRGASPARCSLSVSNCSSATVKILKKAEHNQASHRH